MVLLRGQPVACLFCFGLCTALEDIVETWLTGTGAYRTGFVGTRWAAPRSIIVDFSNFPNPITNSAQSDDQVEPVDIRLLIEAISGARSLARLQQTHCVKSTNHAGAHTRSFRQFPYGISQHVHFSTPPQALTPSQPYTLPQGEGQARTMDTTPHQPLRSKCTRSQIFYPAHRCVSSMRS